ALIFAHRGFADFVPLAGRFAAQVVFADQGFLNFLCPVGIDLLLASCPCRFLSPRTSCTRRGALRSRCVRGGSRSRRFRCTAGSGGVMAFLFVRRVFCCRTTRCRSTARSLARRGRCTGRLLLCLRANARQQNRGSSRCHTDFHKTLYSQTRTSPSAI